MAVNILIGSKTLLLYFTNWKIFIPPIPSYTVCIAKRFHIVLNYNSMCLHLNTLCNTLTQFVFPKFWSSFGQCFFFNVSILSSFDPTSLLIQNINWILSYTNSYIISKKKLNEATQISVTSLGDRTFKMNNETNKNFKVFIVVIVIII